MENIDEFFKRYAYDVTCDRIGGGTFGTVYKAYDNILHRDVAIKVSEQKVGGGGKVFSLRDEFNALKQVPKHPNIANYEELYTFKMPNGVFDYAVMQFYQDGNLSNAIRQGLTTAQKEEVSRALLEGISFLHEHRVVHRDLKPGNILIVRRNGHVIPLITDFGLSKETSAGTKDAFSNSFGGGTLNYSSPEQLRGETLHYNTDLWAYGAIVYEVFTGKRLFDAGSFNSTARGELEVYEQIVNSKNGQNLQALPEPWRAIVSQCLVVDSKQRVQNGKELLRILGVEPTSNTHSSSKGSTILNSNAGRGESPSVGGGKNVKKDDPIPVAPSPKKPIKKTIAIVAASLSGIFLLFAIVAIIASKSSDWKLDPNYGFVADTTIVLQDALGCSYQWKGSLLDGQPDGEGIATYFANDKQSRQSFEGIMQGGQKVEGKLVYLNGNYYEGTFSQDSLFKDGTYHNVKENWEIQYVNGKY